MLGSTDANATQGGHDRHGTGANDGRGETTSEGEIYYDDGGSLACEGANGVRGMGPLY